MNVALLASIVSVPVVSGIVITRFWTKRRELGAISLRLERWASPVQKIAPTLLKRPQWTLPDWDFLQSFPGIETIRVLLDQAGVTWKLNDVLIVMTACLVLPPLMAFALEFSLIIAAIVSLVSVSAIFIYLKVKVNTLRTKFCEQLPDAIDLMIAVLRSGHSIPQAVRSISEEIANPCGAEFQTILHRMNLGQPLSQSLITSAQRYNSYELDLIRRAVAIQAEVGGSLADLLEKTNGTLRNRLKLARQLRVTTSQSRLSAVIIGLLPVVLAVVLNFISPGYLDFLLSDQLGRLLVIAAIFLELLGVFIMHRMSSMKI